MKKAKEASSKPKAVPGMPGWYRSDYVNSPTYFDVSTVIMVSQGSSKNWCFLHSQAGGNFMIRWTPEQAFAAIKEYYAFMQDKKNWK